MSENTKIEWATHSWNPWEGCTKVSPGCANCYAEARNLRFARGANWGKGKPRRRTTVANWHKPVAWNAAAAPCVCDGDGDILPGGQCSYCGLQARPPRVFPSLCDWLDDEVPIEWLADFLKLIRDTPNFDWLLLTKRPQNWRDRLFKVYELQCDGDDSGNRERAGLTSWAEDWINGCAPHNVWLGVSVEDQQRADERIPALLQIPAKIRFLSVEPLLAPVQLTTTCGLSFNRHPDHTLARPDGGGIDWVIIGGESGPRARPCNVEWIRSIVEQCKCAGVPCFVKQLGAFVVQEAGSTRTRWLLDHKKGGDMNEWTDDLCVRQFPLNGQHAALSSKPVH